MIVTRRQVLAGCMAVGAEAMARPVRSLVGANLHRIFEDDDWSVSSADYVQDGLIAMWDGLENDASNVWTDLTGNSTYVSGAGSFTYGTNCTTWSSEVRAPKLIFTNDLVVQAVSSGRFTIEQCLNIGDYSGNKSTFGVYSGVTHFRLWSYGQGFFVNDVSKAPLPFNTGKRTITVCGSSAYDCSVLKKTYPISSKNPSGSNHRVSIGSFSSANSGSAPYSYRGDIYSIRVYDRDLTASEIAANYAIDKRRFGI